MIFLKLWNYIFGYLMIKVDGLSLEKFINLCVSRNIKLWSIQRTGYTSLRAFISIKDFRKLPPIARKVKARIKIAEKRGLPFVTYRLRHRKMLVLGMIIFLVILYGLSSFIWVVEIDGEGKYDEEAVSKIVEDKGIKPGVYKGNIDLWAIENELLIKIPELSWASIEVKGTKAIVRVVEAITPPEIEDRDEPRNVVAGKDGIIYELIVLEGEQIVEVGDTVTKGQLLISGIIEHEDTQVLRYVHARGRVWARTWYEGQGVGKFNNHISKRTGKVVSRTLIDTKNWELFLDKQEPPFMDYVVEERQEAIPFIGKFFGWHILHRDYFEIEPIPMAKRDELARKEAEDNAISNAMSGTFGDPKIIDKKFKYDIIKDKEYKATVYIEVLEDIAEPIELMLN